jgi:two-component system C4-dicarboxylate transport response regulator DctD
VRELQNALQRFLATNQLSLPDDVAGEAPECAENPADGRDLNAAVEAVERRMIRQSLQKTQWHRGKAADMLNIPRRTLQRKMVKYGFRAPDGV